jgi:hypothetical protein
MFRKFVALGLVGLFLAMTLVIAEDSIGPYNPIADVNKDGVVDILDLVEVGQAYGSNYTLMHQANKTTVTVLSFENNNYSYIENALVAVFPQGGEGQWNYTDSYGIVAFGLIANSSYVAIAWDSTRSNYNYANFTTNSFGEALVTIWLGYYPSSSPIRSIPRGWFVITFLDNTTGKPYMESGYYVNARFLDVYNTTSDNWIITGPWDMFDCHTGIEAINMKGFPPGECPWAEPYLVFKARYTRLKTEPPYEISFLCYSIHQTDEYAGAYVVVIINP